MDDPLHFPVPLPFALIHIFFSGAMPYLCMDEFGGCAACLEVWLTHVNIDITGNWQALPDQVMCKHSYEISRILFWECPETCHVLYFAMTCIPDDANAPSSWQQTGTHHCEEVQCHGSLTKSSQGQNSHCLWKEVISNNFFSPLNACNFWTSSDNLCHPDVPQQFSVWQHHFCCHSCEEDWSRGCHPNQT